MARNSLKILKKGEWTKEYPNLAYTRRLLLIKGEKVRDTPLDKIIKKLRLSKQYKFVSSDVLEKDEIFLERMIRKKLKI